MNTTIEGRRGPDRRLPGIDAAWLLDLVGYKIRRDLLTMGYTCREDVATAIASGSLSVDSPNIGPRVMAAICTWLNIPEPKVQPRPRRAPSQKAIETARRTLERAGFTVIAPT